MWQTLNLNPGLLMQELPSAPLHLAASLQKEKIVEKLRKWPKIPELRNGRTMAQTQSCLVSHSVKVCASLCTLALQYGSRLIQSKPYVAFPGFSTHCPTCGVWKHFVQCDGPCRRDRWHLESLYGCGRGRRCLARLVLKSLLTREAAKALAKQWHSPLGSVSHHHEASLWRTFGAQQHQHGQSLERIWVLLSTGILTFKTTVLEPQGTLWLIFPFSVYNAAKVQRDNRKVRHSPTWLGNEERTVAWRERNNTS